MELYITGMANKMIKDFSIKDIKFIFENESKKGVLNMQKSKINTASASFSAPKIKIKNQIFDAVINDIRLRRESIPETFADAKVIIKFTVKKTEKDIPTAAKESLADLIVPSDLITLKRNDHYYALPATKML